MRKIILPLSIILVCFLSACVFFNAPYRKRMLEYYSNDINYEILSGIVISKNEDTAVLEIDISIKNHTFPVNANHYQYFRLYTNVDILKNIKEGDQIIFTSASRYFYDGHDLPIVSLEKEGYIYLTFAEGKKQYLEWIELNFEN